MEHMEHRVRMTMQHTECPSEVFVFVRDDMDVGFGVGSPKPQSASSGNLRRRRGHPNPRCAAEEQGLVGHDR